MNGIYGAGLWAFEWVGEYLSWWSVVGMALIICGVVMCWGSNNGQHG